MSITKRPDSDELSLSASTWAGWVGGSSNDGLVQNSFSRRRRSVIDSVPLSPWYFKLARDWSISVEQLIYACAESNDPDAWREFIVRFNRPISLSIIRTAYRWGEIPQHVVDDLVQETYLKLCADKCRLLRDFAEKHPDAVTGYIKTIAINVTHDYFKSLRSQKRGSGEVDQLIESVQPQSHSGNLGGQDAMEREILLKEIERCLEGCSKGPDRERDRLIFWLYYQQGVPAKAIATLPTIGLTAKGVESVILRLTRMVRERMVDLRGENLISPATKQKGFHPTESY